MSAAVLRSFERPRNANSHAIAFFSRAFVVDATRRECRELVDEDSASLLVAANSYIAPGI
jgi:hypothetical protein